MAWILNFTWAFNGVIPKRQWDTLILIWKHGDSINSLKQKDFDLYGLPKSMLRLYRI